MNLEQFDAKIQSVIKEGAECTEAERAWEIVHKLRSVSVQIRRCLWMAHAKKEAMTMAELADSEAEKLAKKFDVTDPGQLPRWESTCQGGIWSKRIN